MAASASTAVTFSWARRSACSSSRIFLSRSCKSLAPASTSGWLARRAGARRGARQAARRRGRSSNTSWNLFLVLVVGLLVRGDLFQRHRDSMLLGFPGPAEPATGAGWGGQRAALGQLDTIRQECADAGRPALGVRRRGGGRKCTPCRRRRNALRVSLTVNDSLCLLLACKLPSILFHSREDNWAGFTRGLRFNRSKGRCEGWRPPLRRGCAHGFRLSR